MDKYKTILIFGPPGAGKGTIASMIGATGNHYHLSSGEIFRGLAPESKHGKLFYELCQKGQMMPDELTVEIWRKYTEGLINTNKFFPSQQFLMLDGIPRTLAQAILMEQYIDVIHIIVFEVENENELVRRLARRATIEKRVDDASVESVKNRIREYRVLSTQVLEHFPEEIISRFNAELTPTEVLRDVLVGCADMIKYNPELFPAETFTHQNLGD